MPPPVFNSNPGKESESAAAATAPATAGAAPVTALSAESTAAPAAATTAVLRPGEEAAPLQLPSGVGPFTVKSVRPTAAEWGMQLLTCSS